MDEEKQTEIKTETCIHELQITKIPQMILGIKVISECEKCGGMWEH